MIYCVYIYISCIYIYIYISCIYRYILAKVSLYIIYQGRHWGTMFLEIIKVFGFSLACEKRTKQRTCLLGVSRAGIEQCTFACDVHAIHMSNL